MRERDKKKFRYIAQIWKKLNDPNYISFVKNQLKKFSEWGLRYGTIFMYNNAILLQVVQWGFLQTNL